MPCGHNLNRKSLGVCAITIKVAFTEVCNKDWLKLYDFRFSCVYAM